MNEERRSGLPDGYQRTKAVVPRAAGGNPRVGRTRHGHEQQDRVEDGQRGCVGSLPYGSCERVDLVAERRSSRIPNRRPSAPNLPFPQSRATECERGYGRVQNPDGCTQILIWRRPTNGLLRRGASRLDCSTKLQTWGVPHSRWAGSWGGSSANTGSLNIGPDVWRGKTRCLIPRNQSRFTDAITIPCRFRAEVPSFLHLPYKLGSRVIAASLPSVFV